MKFVMKGTPTSTGGVVLEGHESVLVAGKPGTSIYQMGSCRSGRPECKGVGMIVPVSGKNNVNLPDGHQACVHGDRILCGCDDNYILEPDHSLHIGVYPDPTLEAKTQAQIQSAQRDAAARKAQSQQAFLASSSNESSRVKLHANNAYWPPYNPLAQEGEKQLEVEYITPITSIAVLSLEEAQEMYASAGGKELIDNVRDYSGLSKGISEAYVTAKGLGGLGVKATTKIINGKEWIIIRDFRRHQQTLMKGNKWSANNPRVVQAGLGLNNLKGATRFVRFNAGIEIAFSMGVNTADFILRDEATLAEFVGNSAGDLVKGVMALGGAALITSAIFPASVGVMITGMFYAGISFYLGEKIDTVDEHYGFSNDLINKIEAYLK
ncbi:PAAR domain-containing protein [Vibrio sp. TRT 1302]|uniref:PAAR domain-containing protein n=1 Tax=Vibrio sp. TRT 1302 TaxID=3418504 RepID=UPI003CF6639B